MVVWDEMGWIMGDEAVLFLQLLARHGRMGGETLPRVEVRDRTLIAWRRGGFAGRSPPPGPSSVFHRFYGCAPQQHFFFLLEIIWEIGSVGRYCIMCCVPLQSYVVPCGWTNLERRFSSTESRLLQAKMVV